MAQLNRTCHVCGKKYSYCPSCDSDVNKPLWMLMVDSSDCHTIFEVLTEYYLGRLNKEEVKEKLSTIKLDSFDNYVSATKKQLYEIYKEDISEKVEIIEETVVDDVITDNVNENQFLENNMVDDVTDNIEIGMSYMPTSNNLNYKKHKRRK